MTILTATGKHRLALKAALFSASALATIIPSTGNAQLSIMGVLDSRTYMARPTPQAQPQPIPSISQPQATPAIQFPNAQPAPSQPAQADQLIGDRSLFSADELGFNKELGIITASGNVEIVYEDRILIADTVSYNQMRDMVTASGNVQIIESNGDVLFSEHIEITTDLKTGVARKLSLALADNSSISAQEGHRKDGRYTVLKNATYSPCQRCEENKDRPLTWKLTANEIQHDSVQKRVEYSDVFVEIFDIPVAYVPYLSHPDPTRERETGFLAPSYGSNGIGKYLTTPFFYNMSASRDLTLTPTYYFSENQPHLAGEYRERYSNGMIDLQGSVTYADGGKGATQVYQEETRGHIDAEGEFNLNRTWRTGFDINLASDETYIRRYNMDNDADNGHLTSDVYIEGFRGRNYINGKATIYQEQKSTNTDDLQNGKLEFGYHFVSTPSKTGSFIRSDNTVYGIGRRNDTQLSRIASDTSWVLPYTSSTGDIIELDANITAAGYYADNLISASEATEYTGFSSQAVPSLNLSWRKPVSKLHLNGTANEIFEPMVNVKLAPNVGRQSRIPNEDSQDFELDDTNLFKRNRFTGIDKLDGGQRIDYGLNWGIYGHEGGYTQASIGQSYRLREDSTYDSNSGLEDNLSDIVGRIKVKPSEMVDVLYRYRLDKNDLTLNRSETALTVGPKSTEFTLSHIYIEGTGDDSEYGTREQYTGEIRTQISKYWSSSLEGSYRVSEPEGSIYYGGDLVYQDECIGITFDFKRSFSEDRDVAPNDEFSVRFDFKNLGSF